MDVLFDGFSGKSSRGYLGWSSCVLLRPESGRPMLFDTAGFNERSVLIEKLASLGVGPEEVGTVFLSHFHFDHAVNYGLFKNAVFHLHEAEVHHVRENGDHDLAVPFEMYPSLEETGRLNILSGKQGEENGVRWIHTPGHTPGLYSLSVEHGGECWILASDAVKNKEELTTGKAAMTWNERQSKESIAWIASHADHVLPGHDAPLKVSRERGKLAIQKRQTTSVEITTDERRYLLEN